MTLPAEKGGFLKNFHDPNNDTSGVARIRYYRGVFILKHCPPATTHQAMHFGLNTREWIRAKGARAQKGGLGD